MMFHIINFLISCRELSLSICGLSNVVKHAAYTYVFKRVTNIWLRRQIVVNKDYILIGKI